MNLLQYQQISAGSGSTPFPPPPKQQNGQLVLRVPFAPYGPRPGQPNNIFFVDEADVIWDLNPELADALLQPWVARGATGCAAGPIYAAGYHGQYPDTNWIGRGDRYAEFLTWLVQRIPSITLFLIPDVPPYYDGWTKEYFWDRIRRDLEPVYRHPEIQALAKAGNLRVCSQWEQFSSTERMAQVWDWMADVFPDAKRFWHNPAGHGSPCLSTEDEKGGWESAFKHGLTGMLLQGDFVESNDLRHHDIETIIRLPEDQRNVMEQMMYGLWDIYRRFNGIDGSPWGGPMLTWNGTPGEVEAFEGTAYGCYWGGIDPMIVGPQWASACRGVTGIMNVNDGLR